LLLWLVTAPVRLVNAVRPDQPAVSHQVDRKTKRQIRCPRDVPGVSDVSDVSAVDADAAVRRVEPSRAL